MLQTGSIPATGLGCVAQRAKSLILNAHVSPPLEDSGFDKGWEAWEFIYRMLLG